MKRRRLVMILMLCGVMGRVADAQATSGVPAPDVKGAVEKLVQVQRAWGPATSTPNMSLAIEETSRSGDAIHVRLRATGTTKGQTYSLVSWPITSSDPTVVMEGVALDDSGLAVCPTTQGSCKGDKVNDPIDLVLRPASGEPVRLGLVSKEREIRLFVRSELVPLRGADRGCTVEAAILMPGAEVVYVEGNGFASDSTLNVSSVSETETRSDIKKAGPDGRYTTAILPYVEGVTHGVVTITIKSDKCAPSVKVPWGPATPK